MEQLPPPRPEAGPDHQAEMAEARRALEQALQLARSGASPQQVAALIEQALAVLGGSVAPAGPPAPDQAAMGRMMNQRMRGQ